MRTKKPCFFDRPGRWSIGPLLQTITNHSVFEKGQGRITRLWVYDIACGISLWNNRGRQDDFLAIASLGANCLVIVTIPKNGTLFAVAFGPAI